MNQPIIIDSSAFISLSAVTDSNYRKAGAISSKIEKEDRIIIMPGEIFTEIVNVAGKKIGHEAAKDQASKILSSKTVHIEETTSVIRQSALSKFKTQSNSVSFTDCIVMAFADEYQTKEIFGFDDVFRKNGYIRIGIDEK